MFMTRSFDATRTQPPSLTTDGRFYRSKAPSAMQSQWHVSIIFQDVFLPTHRLLQ